MITKSKKLSHLDNDVAIEYKILPYIPHLDNDVVIKYKILPYIPHLVFFAESDFSSDSDFDSDDDYDEDGNRSLYVIMVCV